MRDGDYIITLCDAVLGLEAKRNQTFDFLRNDSGKRLRVDGYYHRLRLVIEYRDRRPAEPVFFWITRRGNDESPADPRRRYDLRRRQLLPRHGITLVELSYLDFEHDSRRQLRRHSPDDRAVIEERLGPWLRQRKAG